MTYTAKFSSRAPSDLSADQIQAAAAEANRLNAGAKSYQTKEQATQAGAYAIGRSPYSAVLTYRVLPA